MAARWAQRGTLLAAGLLLVAACSGDSVETTITPPPTSTSTTTPPPTSTVPSTTTTTTTTAPATTTTIDPLARPEVLVSNVNRNSIDDFDTTGDDLYRIVVELYDLLNYLEGAPTSEAEEMVASFLHPSFPYWNSILVGFLELADNPGWRYTDPGLEVIGVEVSSADGDEAVIRVVDKRGTQIISDASGEEVRRIDGWGPELNTFRLIRGNDSRWRFFDLLESVAASEEDIASLVPVTWTGRQP